MKYAKFSDDFLSYFRLDDNGETLVLTDKRGYTRAVELLPYEERPQGEWIENVERRGCFAGDRTVYSYTCPFCKVTEFKKYPFCHCGADMRGKKNETDN